MLNDLKIGVRIMILVSILLLAMSALGLIGLSVFQETHELSNRTVRSSEELLQMVDSSRKTQVLFKKQVQEWKNILLRGHDPTAFQKYMSNFQKEEKATSEELQRLKAMMTRYGMDVSSVDQALATHGQLGLRYGEALRGFNGGDPESVRAVDKQVNGIDRAPTEAIDSIVKQIENFAAQEFSQMQSQSDAALARFQQIILTALLISLIVGGSIGWFFVRQITRPLSVLQERIAGIAESDGDLTQQIDITSRDEIGVMANKFNLLLNKTRNTIAQAASDAVNLNEKARQLSSTTDEVHQTSEQIALAVDAIARGNQDIANEINQIRDSLHAINGNAQTTADGVKRIVSEFSDVNRTLDDGRVVMQKQKGKCKRPFA
ncbi:HAMP domain-containing protein [Heliobacterium undosum]|uniref:HAMP domain-containing protein n=1 Tax=Heliomicrobium undosum TaxID=121734 RepID=A0A845L4A2_9FIRM|nr:methyl-accepting chemotaxis protein [Heliomicrobium undosum]MZP30009.1 HAMP domain-containing protein [Heliomicrobium undosum]